MYRYLLRSLGVQARRGRSLFLLTLFSVSLGVAAVLSIQIINANALAAFSGSVRAVSGEADLSVLGRVPAFPETLYPRVLADPAVRAAWPLYRLEVALEGETDAFLEVLGFDIFAPVPVPMDWPDGDGEDEKSLQDALAGTGWVAVAPELASRMGWQVGDRFRVSSGVRTAELEVGAEVDFKRSSPLASSRMIVMDIAQAQSLLGRPGELHQIDIVLREGEEPGSVAKRLEASLGSPVEVLRPEQREKRAEGMIAAFRLNLTALSLISLFVGVFLVYSSTQASLVRRREEIGLLRSLGATRGQVATLILAEVTALGGLGTALGIPLGWWAARANLEVVNATLTNLYLLREIETLSLPFRLYLLAASVGIGGALLGAIGPATEMTRRDTRSLLVAFTLHERVSRLALFLALVGASLLIAGGIWFHFVGQRWQSGGFVLGAILLLGLPLFTPLVIRSLCGGIAVRGFGWGYSLKGLAVRLHTASVAVAALGVAVSMLVGITLLIGSFRRTVETWIETTVRADIYITTRSWARAGREAVLADSVAQALSVFPGVRAVDRLRQFPARAGEREIVVAGVEMGLPGGEIRFPLLQGNHLEVFRRVREDGAVLIGEPLARKAGLNVGDTLVLTTPAGPRGFPIAGVSYDYTTERGSAVMDLKTLGDAFGEGPIQNLSLYLEDGVDPERVVDRIRTRFSHLPLEIRSNRTLREEILAIFDQTFAVTRLLQAIALLIAASGITLTLLVLARVRLGELALYRALGAERRQIFRVFVGEGIGIGLLGLLLGALGGIGLALILVHIINPAFFGWTIRLHAPWGALAGQAAAIVGAAVMASLYPALRASRVRAEELSRVE